LARIDALLINFVMLHQKLALFLPPGAGQARDHTIAFSLRQTSSQAKMKYVLVSGGMDTCRLGYRDLLSVLRCD